MESAATSTRRCGCARHARVEAAARPACACRRLVMPRRIHALNGAWIAVFLTVHFLIGISGAWPARYQRNAEAVRAMLSRLPGSDLAPIFLPLLIQAFSGLYLLRKEGLRYRVKRCNRGGQVRFFAQRATAIAILAFLVVHLGTLQEWGFHLLHRFTHLAGLSRYANGGLFDPHGAAFRSTTAAFRPAWRAGRPLAWQNSGLMIFTLLGTLATAFHAANGACTGALVWNLLPSAASKRRWGYLCLAFGIALTVAGAVAWYEFTLSANARSILTEMPGAKMETPANDYAVDCQENVALAGRRCARARGRDRLSRVLELGSFGSDR